MKKLLLLVLFFCAIVAKPFKGLSQTNVSGNITANTTWTKAKSPYILTGSVGVPTAFSLTIEPGVTIRRDDSYQILVNGSLIVKGTPADSISFVSGGSLQSGNVGDFYNIGISFIEFQKSNLSNSGFRFVRFKNESGMANNIRVGNDSPSPGPVKNSGSLKISRSNLSTGYTITDGQSAGNSVDIDSSLIVAGGLYGYYADSERFNVTNSNIYNCVITSDRYNHGISIVNSYVKKTQFAIGCCNANITFDNSKVEDSKIIDGQGSPINGPVTITNSLFINTVANNPLARYVITNSKFIVTKYIENGVYGSSVNSNNIISIGSGNVSGSEFLNLSSSNMSGLYIGEKNIYLGSAPGNSTVVSNLFTNVYDALTINSFSAVTISNNNFTSSGRYHLVNIGLKNFSAVNNYFAINAGKTIDDMIFDSNDDLKYGTITYSPYSTTVLPDGPPLKPSNTVKSVVAGGMLVSWDKNADPNIKSYKVYWGKGGNYAFTNSSTVTGNNSFLVSGVSLTDSIAVTALNNNATGVNDQFAGTESWFSVANLKAPVISSFSPAAAAAGTTVTINGSDFIGVTSVSLGGRGATSYNVVSPTAITVVVSATALSGNVSVTAAGGTTSLPSFTFIPVPTITSIAPLQVVPGGTVTISGTNFTGVTGVNFGAIPAASFNVVSPNTITAVLDAAMLGTYQVSVVSPGGTATQGSINIVQLPTITSFTPTTGPIGTVVTINGTNFVGVTGLTIGGANVSGYSVKSATQITATVADNSVNGNITVTTGSGAVTKAGFLFVPPPVISSFSPTIVKPNDVVLITGLNLADVTAVNFGGIAAASFTITSPTTISAKVSADPGGGGTISVTSINGTATKSGFTIVPVPIIAQLTSNTFSYNSSLYLSTTLYYGFSNQWYKDGAAIAGATGPTYTTSQSGSYTIAWTYGTLTQTSQPVAVLATYPANNFKVAATSVTCKGSNNGSIKITAVQQGAYSAVITSSNGSVVYSSSFTAQAVVANLAGGTYNVCISMGTQGYQQCYSTVVAEPKDLALYSTINKNSNSIDLALSGADFYNIDVNGIKYTNITGSITLALSKGVNNILVTSDKPCQGAIEKRIVISDDITAYPNPFTSSLTLDLGNKTIGTAVVEVFNSFGKRVYRQQFSNQSGNVSLDLSGLAPTQVYILKLTADGTEFINKIVKK